MDPRNIAAYPPADISIECIGDLVDADLAMLHDSRQAGHAQQEAS